MDRGSANKVFDQVAERALRAMVQIKRGKIDEAMALISDCRVLALRGISAGHPEPTKLSDMCLRLDDAMIEAVS